MKILRLFIFLLLIFLTGNCITPFFPEAEEEMDMLVVSGMITDLYGVNSVRLTRSVPLERENIERPYRYCSVIIKDDLDNVFNLTENKPGLYETDPEQFQGEVGREYKLIINNNRPGENNHVYESPFIELIQVPPIDSVYYEKVDEDSHFGTVNACQILLDTQDPFNKCRNFRWDFTETWEFHLPYDSVEHRICWITQNSQYIRIKSTSLMSESKIKGFPLYYIPPYSDRFEVKYSILVNQYSITGQEYDYWQKVQNMAENVGSLYDVVPMSIAGNMYCTDDSAEMVLGYFSVSSVTSKRIFIKDHFEGLTDRYADCPYKKVYRLEDIQGLGSLYWIIDHQYDGPVEYWMLTRFEDCADCRLRGTDVEPSFWHEDEE